MSRRQHRARKLLDRPLELNEDDPIGGIASWRIPDVDVSWDQIEAAATAAELDQRFWPRRRTRPYSRHDVARMLTRGLYEFLGAVSVAEKGGAYFFGAPYFPEVFQLQTFYESLYPGEKSPRCGFFVFEQHLPGDLPRIVAGELCAAIDVLTAEADGFATRPPRRDTLRRRGLELVALQRKCELFDALFQSQDLTKRLRDSITDLEATIEALREDEAA